MSAVIRNLDEHDGNGSETDYDYCIVGAGAAGAYLVRRLMSLGFRVICLEAGGTKGETPEQTDFVPTFTKSEYPGALVGRSLGMGGSTSRWGGLLAPHSEHDCIVAADSRDRETWDHIVRTVNEKHQRVLTELGFDREPEFFSFSKTRLGKDTASLNDAGIEVVSSIFLPFRKKNLSRLIEGAENGTAAKVYVRAVARDWQVDESGKVISLVAVSPRGNELRIEANHFVVASGAIECARVLLEIQRTSETLSLSPDLGRHLGDHISIGIADVATGSLSRATSDYAPRFAGAWMRSFRFLETAPEEGVPRSFSHFVFENESRGFQLAKNLLTSMQARRLPKLSISEVVAGVVGVAKLGFHRFIGNKLHIPSTTTTRLQLDIEQAPCQENRIQLADSRDQYGRLRAEVSWEITDQDMENLRTAAERLLSKWQSQGSALPNLEMRNLERSSNKPHDAFHPVGVCRMGTDPDAVVDLNCSVNGIRNVSVISTALLPSAGTANPTFTMLCLAEHFVTERTTQGERSERIKDGSL